MFTLKQLCCMAMLCIAVMNSACTKEELWSDLPATHVLIEENNSNSNDETLEETIQDDTIVFVADGGVEVNETQLEWELLPIDDCRYKYAATVERQDCGWILKLEDGRTRFFVLEGAESFDFEENTQVRFAAEPIQWTEHECMSLWVNAIKVFCIEKVE